MKGTVLGLAVAASLALFGSVVRADDDDDEDKTVDCSKVSEFSDNYDYYKGDEVKYRDTEYRCGKAACTGEPGQDKAWKVVGECE